MQKKHYLLSFAISGLIISAPIYGLITQSPSTVPDENPYEKDTLVVSMNDSVTEQNMSGIAVDAFDYWESNSELYADYPINYAFKPNATDPDIEIVWVEEVNSCGEVHDEEVAGCAPLVTEYPLETVTIRVETGYKRSVAENTLKHELGHTLGLTHNDEPEEIMASE